MQIEARDLSFDAPAARKRPRAHAMPSLALLAGALAADQMAAVERRAPVVAGAGGCGGSDWLESARQAALNCLPPMIANTVGANCPIPNGSGGTSPNPCSNPLRFVPIGAISAAVGANTSGSVSISPQAPFKPEIIAVNAPAANLIVVTSIQYGPTNMLIGGSITGEMFSTANEQGGYRLPGPWVYPGQSITIGYLAISAVAASTLVLNAFGFTNAQVAY